jgi:hypothetical protein
MNGVVSKPLSPSALIARIAEALSDRDDDGDVAAA